MKDGILIIDKPQDMTSRDVVNIVGKKLNTKRVGHTGTLDPIATGLLVLCVNKATKLVELLTCDTKTYVANVKMGYLTDTLDRTGKTITANYNYQISELYLKDVLNSFLGSYMQEVPIYSAVKVDGKKLYEYARQGISVSLPKKLVTIKDINLDSFNHNSFTFTVTVSKGTYIRSLIRDIGLKMDVYMTMENLRRIRVGNIDINSAIKLEDVSYDKVKDIKDCLQLPIITLSDELDKKVRNGAHIPNIYIKDMILFIDRDSNNIAIYRANENNEMIPYKVF